jgi:predicted membrane-bound mannosyltransferase/sugar lactone lactonase YvrE
MKMANNNAPQEERGWLARPIHPSLPAVTNEIAIFALILLAAVVTRFYNLGVRVMSHDESLHTYFSWLFYKGNGYQHNPMMHGPLQFHLVALSYFLFGASDFTARIPAALFSVATIGMTWYWRRYLGRAGALIAGGLMVISPFMLFYGRYVREDSYAVFSGVLMLYAVLRYFETGAMKYLYWLAVALFIHFIDKETSFIYAAQLLLFLAIFFIARVTRRAWDDVLSYRGFVILLAIGILLIGIGAGLGIASSRTGTLGATEVVAPANPTGSSSAGTCPGVSPQEAPSGPSSPTLLLVGVGVLALVGAAYFLLRGMTWQKVKTERSFSMLILVGTLILPMLVPLPMKLFEKSLCVSIPTTTSEVQALTTHDVIVVGLFVLGAFIISLGIGLLWNREWWKLALAFWLPFTVFYTSIFTNTDGFFTGIVGSLGYWLAQQAVQRGSQPWYYYLVVQIPIYEFLPFLGVIVALIIGLRRRHVGPAESVQAGERVTADEVPIESGMFPTMFALLVWWIAITITSLSLAGEKMPWLTIHIAWPMILLTGWGLGALIEKTDFADLRRGRAPLVLAVILVFFTSFSASMISLLGATPPFQGSELNQLQATGAFLLPGIVAIASAVGLVYLLRDWSGDQVARAFVLTFFALLAVLTVRASFRAAYIDYDDATEYLVYAHSATGVKDVIKQATEISERSTGGMGLNIAYDASAPDTGVSWPFVWYLRDFTNQHSFDQPTRSLRDSAVVVVDSKNFDKIEQALGPGYYRIDYIRMWWPNQDYFGLVNDRQPSIPFDDGYSCKGPLGFLTLFKSRDFSRVCSAILDPRIRAGIFDIWLNRDYTAYAEATGHTDLTLATWQPADQMRMYIKKDVAQQIWKYGALPTQQTSEVDPYEGKTATFVADQVIEAAGLTPPMNAPRSLAFGPDGTLYVADSRNQRILHFDPSGNLINQWGSASGNDPNNPNPSAPPSTFNEPWGVAVGPDGSVYVTDTWNHRVQKFGQNGEFIKTWGTFGQGNQEDTFYGPRGIAVDARGRVYVVDTGNKRVAVFDSDGNYVTQFGSEGLDPGQFDEPVGIAIDTNGTLYVTDTWNQRVQTFAPAADGASFTPLMQWDVAAWYGQSLDNKPFIAVDAQGHVFVTDPEGYRVIEYTTDGQLIQTWGDYGISPSTFGIAAGVAVDGAGHVWVTDAGNNRIMRFTLP